VDPHTAATRPTKAHETARLAESADAAGRTAVWKSAADGELIKPGLADSERPLSRTVCQRFRQVCAVRRQAAKQLAVRERFAVSIKRASYDRAVAQDFGVDTA
jgi:hypothetical protein